jgi:hypothetical protein
MFEVQSLPRKLEAALVDVKDPKAKVRMSAVRDLVQYAQWDSGTAAVAALEAALRDDDTEVRCAACVAIADAGASAATAAVRGLLSDGHVKVRQMALLALGEVAPRGEPEVIGSIRPFVTAADASLRFQSLHAFALVGPIREDLRDVLVAALDDRDPEVRYLAVRLLEENLVAENDEMTADVEAAFRHAMEDKELRVQLAAAVALPAKSADEGIRKLLVRGAGAKGSDRVDEDLAHAIERCGELGLREAIPALEVRAFRGLRKDTLTFQARIALARMGHAKAKETILADLRSWNRDRRNQGVVSVGQARMVEARENLERARSSVDPVSLEEALSLIDAAG